MRALLADDYEQTCLWQRQVDPPATAVGDLPDVVDVVVVGAGTCGLEAARTLAGLGRSVLVLEREPLGWGASSRNGGMVIPELKAGPEALEHKLGPLGRRLHTEVNEAFDHVESLASDWDCDYRRAGQLLLAHSPRHVEPLRAMAAEHDLAGDPARFLWRDELAGEVGSDAFHAGVVFDRTGSLHPAKFHARLAAEAIAAGALVHDRTAVTGYSPPRPRGGGHRVDTTKGIVQAGAVVVATNAEADAAVPWLARRVLPIGSFIIATEVLDPDLAHSVSPTRRMMVDTKNLLLYWRLTPDGRMAFGGRRSLDPVEVPAARDFLYGEMVRVHPQLAGVGVEHAWGGHVAMTLDRLPHVGVVDGAWYAAGCNGSGVATNTWLGHRLGLLLAGEAPPPALAELPHRPIPLDAWRAVWMPVVSRWFSWQDRR